MFKVGVLFLTLFIGSYAFPAKRRDFSLSFDHTGSSSRIVGGTVTGNVPHMVALSVGVVVRNFFCGGSLVTNRHVLTAAHCLVPVVSEDGSVNFSLRGTVGTNILDSGGIQIVFARGIIHEDYKPEPIVKNDIGILVSTATIHLSDTIQLVSLNYNWVNGGVPTTVHGWGRTSEGGPVSQVLLQLNAEVLDGDFCVEEVARRAVELNWATVIPPVDPKLEICTFHSAERGICQGDSGGALLRSDSNEQIGIASWVLPCARNAPDVFVRISYFKNWLEKNLI
ncbi:unnamed protein product, partial [Brenthis ino]